MSVDKRLEYELSTNLRNEEKLLETLAADRLAQLQNLRNHQYQIDLKSGSKADLTKHYLARDDAFFKHLHILQQLSSNVKLVSDYRQPVEMPKIKASDTRIYSAVDKHDLKNSDYLADFEEFMRDKQAHEKEIERINRWIIDIHDEIRAIILPQILYFLLNWLPPLIHIYRYFAPINALDQAIKQGQVLDTALTDLEQQIETEDTRFYKRWNEKYTEYSALSMNEKKLAQLRSEQTQYEQISNSKQILDIFVHNCNDSVLQRAMQNFKRQPNYINLFHMASLLCEKKFNDSNSTQQIDQVLEAITHLYPEVQAQLNQFTQATLFNLRARSFFDLIEDKYQRLINTNKNTQEKIKRAEKRMGDIATHSTSLHPIHDAKLIYDYKLEIQRLNTLVENGKEELSRRRHMIEPFKHFLNNRTGESLKNLYQFLSDPSNEESNSFAVTLKKIYPAAIEALEIEQQGAISIQTSDVVSLQEQYLKQLLLIKGSHDPHMQPLKEVATALHLLLTTPDWTWSHFNTIEKSIRRHPEYAHNPTLAGLFNRATQLVAASRQFQPKIIKQSPAPLAPELIINQANPLPTFFQPPSRVSAVANALIKNIMGNINSYQIRTSDQTLSSDEKQLTIDSIADDMLQYIDMLSSADATQTISPQHLALLSDLTTFIRQMTSRALPHHLNEEDIAKVGTLLVQLDQQHPIRKGVEFLITLFRNKKEYMTVDTRYAQIQLDKDILSELRTFSAEEVRHQEKVSKQKKPLTGAQSSAAWMERHHWSVASSMQNLIKDYVANLKQFPSPHNAKESRALQAVATLVQQLHSTLRYEPSKYEHIPQLLHQLEQQCAALGEHPIRKAAMHMISALKETKEYAEVPVEGKELRAKK